MFTSDQETDILIELINSLDCQSVLEFGIGRGEVADRLLRACSCIERYTGIDILFGTPTTLQRQRKQVPKVAGALVAGDPRVTIIVRRNGSRDLTTADLGEFDFAYIDGDHSFQGVKHDSELARAIVRRAIAWHDYGNVPSVTAYLDEHESAGLVRVPGTFLCYAIVGGGTPLTSRERERVVLRPEEPLPDGRGSFAVDEKERFHAEARRIAGLAAPAFFGDGIVTCASERFFPWVHRLCNQLRRMGCRLPIELWHLKDEVPAGMAAALRKFDVECRDAGDAHWSKDSGRHAVHGFKSYAIHRCSFRRVLFLDADNLPLRDVTPLFDSAEFEVSGAILWPDITPPLPGKEAVLRESFGLPSVWRECESGQLLVDKSRCWRGLSLAEYVNSRQSFYYPQLYGDKQTYAFAFDAMGTPYTVVPHRPTRYRQSLIQKWFGGSDLFCHKAGAGDKFASARFEPLLPAEEAAALQEEMERDRQEMRTGGVGMGAAISGRLTEATALREMELAVAAIAGRPEGLALAAGDSAAQSPSLTLPRSTGGGERSEAFAGRGIVIPAGSFKYFPGAWVCVRMLRRLGCGLPIQLWHLGEREMTPDMRQLVEPLGVECVDALKVRQRHPMRILNGWELKPYAIARCPFREVLLLDADNVPVVDPGFLFDTAEFAGHGAIFWPDFGRLAATRKIWELTGVPWRDEPEFETGQIVIDKQRCRQALALTLWMNEHSDFWYEHVHGDKETFHLAWRKLGMEYAMPSKGIAPLPGVMCQHDFAGRRIFQHSNMAKWSLAGNRRIAGFLFEAECLEFLGELRQKWRPSTPAPLATEAARALAGRRFTYERVGYDSRGMTLEADGRIGEGRAGGETSWWLEDGGALVIAGIAGVPTCRLLPNTAGIWEGRWLAHEKMPIRLAPRQ